MKKNFFLQHGPVKSSLYITLPVVAGSVLIYIAVSLLVGANILLMGIVISIIAPSLLAPIALWLMNTQAKQLATAYEELQAAKESAEYANEAKSQFLANMSHELRTPLNHILGFTELVLSEKTGSLNTKQKEYLNDALGSGRHLLSLINEILDLAKVESGKAELDLEPLDVEEECRQCVAKFEDRASRRMITLIVNTENLTRKINADKTKFNQILYNLVSNATKFTPEGGRVEVCAAIVKENPGHEELLLSVGDSGIGLTEDDIERIFQPFVQMKSGYQIKQPGTGLGLSLTLKLVELHGGDIRVESDGPGLGTTFTVRMPV